MQNVSVDSRDYAICERSCKIIPKRIADSRNAVSHNKKNTVSERSSRKVVSFNFQKCDIARGICTDQLSGIGDIISKNYVSPVTLVNHMRVR